MIVPQPPTGLKYSALSADATVKTGQGTCVGILCCESSSLVITLYDNTAASGTKIVDSLPMSAKEWQDIPAEFTTGLYVDISGSGKFTVFFL